MIQILEQIHTSDDPKEILENHTFDEEKFDAAVTEVVAADVYHELHVGVPVQRGLAFWACLIFHLGPNLWHQSS